MAFGYWRKEKFPLIIVMGGKNQMQCNFAILHEFLVFASVWPFGDFLDKTIINESF